MVLDILKKENVKATFFVNGKNCIDVKNDPLTQKLIKREAAEGHIIASHTYSHPLNGITSLTDA
jgi:peptidoglycan/xylan/chitin deacetylase (PgdA/CDA1 family)